MDLRIIQDRGGKGLISGCCMWDTGQLIEQPMKQ